MKTIGIHDDFEVIVIDDHSTKDTLQYEECVASYSKRKGFVFLENDADKKGAGSARNVGLRHATGEWLLFADSDDIFLDSMHEEITKFVDSDYDIVFFPPYIDRSQGIREAVQKYKAICKAYQQGVEGADTLLRYQFVAPWSKLIRHRLVKENRIQFDEVMFSNDVMFSTRCGCYASKITASSNPIYFSSLTAGSLVTKKTMDSFFTRAEVTCVYFSFIRENATSEQKSYLSSCSGLRTYYRIIRNGYGLRGIRKYTQLLKKYHIAPVQLQGFRQTYRVKKKLNSLTIQ